MEEIFNDELRQVLELLHLRELLKSLTQAARGTGPGIVTPFPFTITKLGS